MKVRVATGVALLGGVALVTAGCGGGPSADDKAKAVDIANARFGNCLNIAGYDVNPANMVDTAGPGAGSGTVLVYFMSESGGSAIRVYVTPSTGAIQALDSGDLERLDQAGC